MNSFDIYIQNYISVIRSVDITTLMYLVSRLFDFSFYSVLMFLSVAVLIKLFRGRKYAFVFILSIFTTVVGVYLLKILFNVSRPTDSVISAFGQSFPSYHATIATVFFVMLMYVFDPVILPEGHPYHRVDEYFKSLWRILFNTLCVIFIILVSFSRIYLGVHWFSDVFAGILLGILISYLSVKLFRVRLDSK